jgi:hypothetical protein
LEDGLCNEKCQNFGTTIEMKVPVLNGGIMAIIQRILSPPAPKIGNIILVKLLKFKTLKEFI